MKRQAQFVSSGKIRSLEYMKKESVELSMTFCGYEECDAGYHYIPSKRNYYMLHVMSRGKGMCKVGEETYFMEAGNVLLVYPEQECSYIADPEEGCTLLWAGFIGMRAEECAMHAGFSETAPVRRTIHVGHMEQLVEKLLEVREMTFENDLRRNGLLRLFFAELIDEYNSKSSKVRMRPEQRPDTSEYIKGAIAYIAQNYSENIKINELADYVGVNRCYLASSFKKATGYSPKEYLLSLRMEKAKSLLETTDMPVNSISNAVGYSDQLAFSRMFKRYTGVSPTVYREEHKK